MKIFISQPMKDKTNAQIEEERNIAIKLLQHEKKEPIEVIDSFFKDAPHDAAPLWFLGKSFELLSTADIAVFIGDWKKYKGCQMEHRACEEYGITTRDYSDIIKKGA